MGNGSQRQKQPSFTILVKDAAAALRTGSSSLKQKRTETDEQLAVLRRLQSHYAQGFLISKRIVAIKFTPFFASRLK